MTDILTVLFETTAKTRVLRFFILNPQSEFDINSLRDRTMLKTVELRREISRFKKIGLIKERSKRGEKTYQTNVEFPYYPELNNLFLKSTIYPQCKSFKKLKTIGD
ncbi:MAG: hypothetical protein KC736_04785, partial [Candidatus Moranbacteria bacterium]|nr:hypothetical protein [Candidatus Moranbacteria bacterium]